ncbi:MAG: helix-turn-helix transcriptional regulator [Streptosporangiaceae bacterium]
MSAVVRRRLASELRRLREAAQLTTEDVAARLECSASKISRIETGRVLAGPRDVRDMAGLYGVPDELRDSLVQLARESRSRGWWQGYGDTVQPHLATFLGLEHDASQIRIWNLSRLPSLMWTEDYARAVFSAARTGQVHPDTDRSVALVTERQRQAALTPPGLSAVLDEAALRHHVGGQQVLRGQLEHLIELSARPQIRIQVMPYTSSLQIAMDASFTIMGFPDPADPDVVCIGYPTGLLWIEDTTEVDRYNDLFRQLQAAALSDADSAAFMTSLAEDL